MKSRPQDCARGLFLSVFCAALAMFAVRPASAYPQSSSSSHSQSSQPEQSARTVGHPGSVLDDGSVQQGVYRNKALGLSCKIPPGWVLRTDEMNAREEDADPPTGDEKTQPPFVPQGKQGAQGSPERGGESDGGRVLLAVFSRPPDAKGVEVNASILIAVERAAAYPGLTEAAQYFGPLTEVAKAQGFVIDEEPYDVAVGAKTWSAEIFTRTWESL